MIPPQVEAVFQRDVARALTLAQTGMVKIGYRCLDEALALAEGLIPTEWTCELIERYHRAIVEYTRAHRLSFALPREAESLAPPPLREVAGGLLTQAAELRSTASELKARAREVRGAAERARAHSREVQDQARHARQSRLTPGIIAGR